MKGRGMRRVLATCGLVVMMVPMITACSSNDKQHIYTKDADEVVPSSGYFGQPNSVTVGTGSMQVTISELRLETNSNATVPESIAIADITAVAEFGETFIEPEQVHVYASDGEEFQRMENPESFLANPLVRTDLNTPGQEARGSVAFVVPSGIRIGRVDFISGESTVSFTVVRQPINPADATETPEPGAEGGQ